MVVNFTHIALHVREIDTCVSFHKEFCGPELAHEKFGDKGQWIVWMAELGHENDFVLSCCRVGPAAIRASGTSAILASPCRARTPST